MNNLIISFENVSKKYIESISLSGFKSKLVLDDINLKIFNGEKVLINGPNGSGKTTLLKLITEILMPNNGKIIFHQKLRKSFISSNDRSFYARLTAFENLSFFASLDKIPKEQFLKNYQEYGNILDVKDFEEKKFNNLSSGQKKKLAILRGLIKKPDLLVLDEPMTYLDQRTKENFITLLNTEYIKNSNKSIFYASNTDENIKFTKKINISEKNIIENR